MSKGRFADMPDVLHAYNFPRWKWPVVRQCFPKCKIIFLPKDSMLPIAGWLVLWGMAPIPIGLSSAIKILRMEDGFLRSVGLGADLVKPVSWIVDGQGIYYDAHRPSDLENILAKGTFDEALCYRSAQLRKYILATGLTKYNVAGKSWKRPLGSKRVILVPGQVESDASIAYGSVQKLTNIELLQTVREKNPDAYIVYKPHPDVLAGLRALGKGEQGAPRWCDEVVVDSAIGELLTVVDEVHTLTSLTGFEALLRCKSVTCYGQPFYSGWGLTHDIYANARRTRKLTIDELVAGALIQYPLYLSRDGKRLITPEEALESLIAWRHKTGGIEPWWRGIFRVFLRRITGVP